MLVKYFTLLSCTKVYFIRDIKYQFFLEIAFNLQ